MTDFRQSHNGGCLCGAVRYEVRETKDTYRYITFRSLDLGEQRVCLLLLTVVGHLPRRGGSGALRWAAGVRQDAARRI